MGNDAAGPMGTTAGGNAQDMDLSADMFRSGRTVEETFGVMNRRNIGPVNVTLHFTEVDGMALVEGDIVLGPVDEVRGTDDPHPLGIVIEGDEYRWPDGKVPYVTKEALRPRVMAAIAHWEQHTPLRFIERTSEPDYLSFEQLNGCWSRVGRQGGMQVISLGLGCGLGAAIHEIGHALGLWHEQSRADRDDHIEIVEANIDPANRHNFDKHVLDGNDVGPYDYGSIMHYPATAFSVNGQATIRTKDGQPIGQRNGLSAGDIAAIRTIYPNLEWSAVASQDVPPSAPTGQAAASGQTP